MTNEELAALDLAVARAEGVKHLYVESFTSVHKFDSHGRYDGIYAPTRDRDEAMRLLEKYGFSVSLLTAGDHSDEWFAVWRYVHAYGPTPAIAICKAIVALSGGTPTEGSGCMDGTKGGAPAARMVSEHRQNETNQSPGEDEVQRLRVGAAL